MFSFGDNGVTTKENCDDEDGDLQDDERANEETKFKLEHKVDHRHSETEISESGWGNVQKQTVSLTGLSAYEEPLPEMVSNVCSRCYDLIIPKVEKVFSRYGRLVSRHPWKFILIPLTVNLLLCIGLVRFHMLIDIDKIYSPQNSRSEQDRKTIEKVFPDTTGTFFRSYQTPTWGRWADVIVRPYSGNILSAPFLRESKLLISYVSKISAYDDAGKQIAWTDICARMYNKCAIDGSLLTDDEFISAVERGVVTYPFFNHSLLGPFFYEHNVAGAVFSSGVLQRANRLLLRFNIRTDSDRITKMAKKWEDAFIQAMETYSSDKFDVLYSHQDSLSEEVNDNMIGDLTFIVLAFFFIGLYACLATFTATTNCVSQRAALGLPGVLAAGLAAGSSMGLITACGMEVVSVVGAVPFLILGVGVDDMFMLMSGLANARYDGDIETRIAETMRTSGISITITSLTDLLAFAAGTSSVFLSVRNFCIFAGVAVCFCYINQCTIFMGCLVLNERRIRESRHFITGKPVQTQEANTALGKSEGHILCCSGRPPRNQLEAESFLDKLPRWGVTHLVNPKPMKFLIILVFLGYIGVSIWGIVNLKEGIDFKTTVREKSYHYKYRYSFDSEFQWLTPLSLVFDREMDYSNSKTQQNVNYLVKKVKSDVLVKDYFEINWLSAYLSYRRSFNVVSPFVQGLQNFFKTRMGYMYHNDVAIDASKGVIVASRIHLLSEAVPNSQDQAKLMTSLRKSVDDNGIGVFIFSNLFIYYEQFQAVLPQTIQTVGIAVAMVFLVTFLLMPHPLMMVFVTLTVTLITTGVFGFLYYLNMSLNSMTMMQVIMSIGFSVDFVAHICHGFLIASRHTRQDRVNEAILLSGPPVFHGAVSTFLGMCALAFAQSFVYFSFFKVMSVVILLGICHALLLLPVILSLFGPHVRKTREINKEVLESARNIETLDVRYNVKTASGTNNVDSQIELPTHHTTGTSEGVQNCV